MTDSTLPAGNNRDPADTLAGVGNSRGWMTAYGVLTIITGIAAVAWPGATLLVIAVLFAIQLVILGVFRIGAAVAMPDVSGGRRVLYVFLGVLAILVGILCLRAPFGTVAVLALFLGAFWVVNGLIEIIDGISARGESGRGWLITSGVLSTIAGVVVLAFPLSTAVALAWILGILLVVHGIVVLVRAFSRSTVAASSPGVAGDAAPSVAG